MYCTLIIGTAYKVTSCEETKIYIFSATNLPCLVDVVCERPLSILSHENFVQRGAYNLLLGIQCILVRFTHQGAFCAFF